MGESRQPEKVKLVIGLLFKDAAVYIKTRKDLVRAFGRIDFESEELDFIHSSYYADEMGEGLKRKFFSFERLSELKKIYTVKVKTNLLEKKYSKDGKRTINIDPGYLNLSKLVLFSTKDYTHRLYLGDGIFAEVTLFYKDNTYNAWPWTYPDYKSSEYLKIFGCIRQIYRDQAARPLKRCM